MTIYVGKLPSEIWLVVEIEQDFQFLHNFCCQSSLRLPAHTIPAWFLPLIYWHSMSTDPELNANTDYYEFVVKIW